MRTLQNLPRSHRLVQNAIDTFQLDLKGITVLTEAASGPFSVTPIIAALAGASKVFAIGRDSSHGNAIEVFAYIDSLRDAWRVPNTIEFITGDWGEYAPQVNLITNLGFVRPISSERIARLPRDAAVALMWEPWEFRAQDLDLAACCERAVPILGTNEHDPRLQTFRYLGALAEKLMFEREIEVLGSSCVLVGSGIFAEETEKHLRANGAQVHRLVPGPDWTKTLAQKGLQERVQSADAVILMEHHHDVPLLGTGGIPLEWVEASHPSLIHICGRIPETLGAVVKHPARKVPFGTMTVTTDYLGPKPVIDLHTAGLKVGAELVRGLRKFSDTRRAVQHALQASPALDFPT